MARPKVVTVRLERQPHHDAVRRLQAAYGWLRRRDLPPAVSDPRAAPAPAQSSAQQQEVLGWLK